MSKRGWVVALLCVLAVACGGSKSTGGGNVTPPDAGTSVPLPPPALDETRSTVSRTSADGVTADGVASISVHVQLFDATGAALSGVAVDVDAGPDATVDGSGGVTDASGGLDVAIRSQRAEPVTVRAVAHLASGLTPLSSQATLHFVADAAAQLVFQDVPQRMTAGAPASTPISVVVEDAWGNVVTHATPTVTLALADSTPDVILGTLSQLAASGVARFDGVAFTAVTAKVQLTATVDGLPVAVSPPIEIIAGPPSALTSTYQRDGWSAQADGVQGYTLRVSLLDGYGNPCVGLPVSVQSTGTDNTFSPAASVLTGGDGKAAILLTSTHAESKQVSTTAPDSLHWNETLSFNPGPAVLSHSSLTITRDTAVADGSSTVTFNAQVLDAHDNPSGSNLWVNLVDANNNSQSWQYFQVDAFGHASGGFSSPRTGPYQIVIGLSDGQLKGSVQFVPGPASKLTFTAAPTGGYAGEPLAPTSVAITDAWGHVVTDATEPITLSLQSSGALANLSGTLTVAPIAGVATFGDLSVDRSVQGATLAAASASFQGTSNAFGVSAWHAVGPSGGDVTAVLQDYNTQYVATRHGGVLVSTDNGKTFKAGTGLGGASITNLYVAGQYPASLFALGPDGLFYSSDAGATWTERDSDLPSHDVRSVVWHPHASAFILGTASGVYLSPSAGTHWYPQSDGLTDLDVTAVLSNGSRLFAGTASGAIFRSLDDGASWTQVLSPVGAAITAFVQSPYTVDTLLASSAGSGVFTSTDGGVTWTALAASPATVHGLAYRYSTAYAMTDNGLWYSGNNGTAWTQLDATQGLNVQAFSSSPYYSQPSLLGTSQALLASTDGFVTFAPESALIASAVGDVAVAPSDATVAYAANSVGIYVSHDSGRTWASVKVGAFVALAVDPADANVVYAATSGSVVYASTDAGAHWSALPNGLPGETIVSVVVDPVTAGQVLVATDHARVFVHASGATSWTESNAGQVATGAVSLRADASNPKTFYLATTDAGVLKSTDDGLTWATSSSGLPASALTALTVGASGELYVATGDAVYASQDQAATWTALGATGNGIVAVGEAPGAPATLFYVDASGLHRSDDSGASWGSVATPAGGLGTLAMGPSGSNLVLVGTSGAGVLRSGSLGL